MPGARTGRTGTGPISQDVQVANWYYMMIQTVSDALCYGLVSQIG